MKNNKELEFYFDSSDVKNFKRIHAAWQVILFEIFGFLLIFVRGVDAKRAYEEARKMVKDRRNTFGALVDTLFDG